MSDALAAGHGYLLPSGMAMASKIAARAGLPGAPYQHITEHCFGAAIGVNGLSETVFAAALGEAEGALARLRADFTAGGLPALALAHRDDDLAALQTIADALRTRCDDVVVLGAGGSSLGGQTVTALAAANRPPRLHFADNIDPDSIAALFDGLDIERSAFIAISKSGTTAETLAQLLAVSGRMGGTVGERVIVITQPADSPLRRFAERHGCTIVDHDPGIAGRFSVLSPTAMLPALIAGVDAAGVRAGAAAVLDAAFAADHAADAAPAVGAAIGVGLATEHGLCNSVIMPYADRLHRFAHWYRQLWAESLGKDGKGTTPIAALGATDQHSQLQLYLDGPRDKMFSLITIERAGGGPRIAAAPDGDEALSYLAGKTIGDLMAAEQHATADSLAAAGRPLRRFHLARLDERALGGLLMHFMIETIITADIWGVDPFDQPAVDDGKARARAYLAGRSAP